MKKVKELFIEYNCWGLLIWCLGRPLYSGRPVLNVSGVLGSCGARASVECSVGANAERDVRGAAAVERGGAFYERGGAFIERGPAPVERGAVVVERGAAAAECDAAHVESGAGDVADSGAVQGAEADVTR